MQISLSSRLCERGSLRSLAGRTAAAERGLGAVPRASEHGRCRSSKAVHGTQVMSKCQTTTVRFGDS